MSAVTKHQMLKKDLSPWHRIQAVLPASVKLQHGGSRVLNPDCHSPATGEVITWPALAVQ